MSTGMWIALEPLDSVRTCEIEVDKAAVMEHLDKHRKFGQGYNI